MTVSRDRQLNPWRRAAGPALQGLVRAVLARVDAHEQDTGARQRRRRPDDQSRHERMVEIVVCELALAVLDPPERGRFVVSLRYRNQPRRYREAALSERLPGLLERLAELGLVSVRKGTRPGVEATACAPTAAFECLLGEHRATLADLGMATERGDLIVLSRTTKVGRRKTKTRIDYRDTPETERLRAEMRAINDHLARGDIAFEPDGMGFVDVSDRHLIRRFTVMGDQGPRFDQCGRLFGGFHQRLPKARRSGLRINGEPVVELDFSSMFTRIALAEVGACHPALHVDLYAMPGLETVPRKQVKAALNALYFTSPSPRRRLHAQTRWPPRAPCRSRRR